MQTQVATNSLTNTQRFFLKAIALGLIYVNKYGVIRNEVTGNYFGMKSERSRYVTVALPDWGRQKKKRAILAHILVWIRYHGPIPKGMEINHKDGDKHNNWLSNLELVTSKQNKEHAIRNGLHVYLGGQHSGRAFYKDKQVVRLRREWKTSRLSMFEFWRTQPPKNRSGIQAFRWMLRGKTYKHADMI
jgi:hypothetical protein